MASAPDIETSHRVTDSRVDQALAIDHFINAGRVKGEIRDLFPKTLQAWTGAEAVIKRRRRPSTPRSCNWRS